MGIVLQMNDLRKFVWCVNKGETDTAIINAPKYDRHRQKAIKHKIERNLWINTDQIEISDYYITTNKSIIAWLKLDPRWVNELHRRAAQSNLKDFRTCTFVPKLARDRKLAVDSLLMEYKRVNTDFRYIVRNSTTDIKVLIKRISEGYTLPYREVSLKVLGALSPLKTTFKDEEEQSSPTKEVDEEGFSKTPSKVRPNYIPKDQIFDNITSILNGFATQQKPVPRRL